jgi:hypothetical protein
VYPVARFDTREEAKDWLLDYCQQAAE